MKKCVFKTYSPISRETEFPQNKIKIIMEKIMKFSYVNMHIYIIIIE